MASFPSFMQNLTLVHDEKIIKQIEVGFIKIRIQKIFKKN